MFELIFLIQTGWMERLKKCLKFILNQKEFLMPEI
nr:MAG TPA: hypothetical protein [Myoviridae sp. ct3tv2]